MTVPTQSELSYCMNLIVTNKTLEERFALEKYHSKYLDGLNNE